MMNRMPFLFQLQDLLFLRFDVQYDAEPFTYEDEELEPPPPEDREDAEDEAQLTHRDDSSGGIKNVVNGVGAQSQQIIASGEIRATGTAGSKAIPPDQRSTTPYMTKYERARILGTRALQIRYAKTCDTF